MKSKSVDNMKRMLALTKVKEVDTAALPVSSYRRPPDPITSVALECHKLVGSYNPKD